MSERQRILVVVVLRLLLRAGRAIDEAEDDERHLAWEEKQRTE